MPLFFSIIGFLKMTKTVKINDIEYPVYCTVEEAEQYFATKLDVSQWKTLNEEDKAKVLVEATRKLNTLKYEGFPVALDQPLAFPRYFKPNFLSKRTYTSEANAIEVNGKSLILIEMPKEMICACCEQAIFVAEYAGLSGKSVHIKNQRLGISSINIGGGNVSYNGNYLLLEVCPEATQFIDKYLIKSARVV